MKQKIYKFSVPNLDIYQEQKHDNLKATIRVRISTSFTARYI